MRVLAAPFSRNLLTIAVLMAGSVHATDRVITAPVTISENDPQRITVRQNITASASGVPVILVNASSGGILIDIGKTIDTNPGPFGEQVNPSAADNLHRSGGKA